MEQEFTEQFTHALGNIAHQLYGAMQKEVSKQLAAEGKDYAAGYRQGLQEGKQKILEHFPMWKIAPADDYLKESVLAGTGEFGMRVLHRGMLIKAGWKYVPIKALKMLLTEATE